MASRVFANPQVHLSPSEGAVLFSALLSTKTCKSPVSLITHSQTHILPYSNHSKLSRKFRCLLSQQTWQILDCPILFLFISYFLLSDKFTYHIIHPFKCTSGFQYTHKAIQLSLLSNPQLSITPKRKLEPLVDCSLLKMLLSHFCQLDFSTS